jgi:hypothetical protein
MILWGVALLAVLLMPALGHEQGRELQLMLLALIVVGVVAWRIWKRR